MISETTPYPLPRDNPTPPPLVEQLVASYQQVYPQTRSNSLVSIHDFITQVAPLFFESMQQGRIDELKRAAQVYRPQVDIRIADTQLLEMQKNAAEAVLRGSEWLSALQVGELAGRSASNPAALANRWKREGKLFSISWNGKDWYPRYAFDAVLQPRPLIAEVIKIFGPDTDPWRIAAWFESSNAWLDEQKPHQCITDSTDTPHIERILEAARKKDGWQHG